MGYATEHSIVYSLHIATKSLHLELKLQIVGPRAEEEEGEEDLSTYS